MGVYDTVVLTRDVPESGLTKGMQGVIVLIFSEPRLGYEVEFCDQEGRTIAEVALTPEQIAPVGLARL
jgi:Domain of unknown function (DUF4926)